MNSFIINLGREMFKGLDNIRDRFQMFHNGIMKFNLTRTKIQQP